MCLGYDTGEQPMIQCEHCSNWCVPLHLNIHTPEPELTSHPLLPLAVFLPLLLSLSTRAGSTSRASASTTTLRPRSRPTRATCASRWAWVRLAVRPSLSFFSCCGSGQGGFCGDSSTIAMACDVGAGCIGGLAVGLVSAAERPSRRRTSLRRLKVCACPSRSRLRLCARPASCQGSTTS